MLTVHLMYVYTCDSYLGFKNIYVFTIVKYIVKMCAVHEAYKYYSSINITKACSIVVAPSSQLTR